VRPTFSVSIAMVPRAQSLTSRDAVWCSCVGTLLSGDYEGAWATVLRDVAARNHHRCVTSGESVPTLLGAVASGTVPCGSRGWP